MKNKKKYRRLSGTGQRKRWMRDREQALARLGFDSYSAYLESEHWRARSARFRNLWPGCFICGERLVVIHHLRYEVLGREEDHDLVSLCRRHHAATHRFHLVSGTPLLTAHRRLSRLVERKGEVVVDRLLRRRPRRRRRGSRDSWGEGGEVTVMRLSPQEMQAWLAEHG